MSDGDDSVIKTALLSPRSCSPSECLDSLLALPCPGRVVPLWGQRLKRILPDAAYYEISPAGCVS